jgi:YVTN family beta-propeller protein
MLTRVSGVLLALALLAAGPTSAAAAPKVYVGLFKDNAVAVVDAGQGRPIATIPVPPGPHGLAMTPDGRKVYVSSDGASTVSVIDTTTDRVIQQIHQALGMNGELLAGDTGPQPVVGHP